MNRPSTNTVMDLAKQPQRSVSWIKTGKPVLVLTGVTDSQNLVDISPGRICSTKDSHAGADNLDIFVIWHDKAIKESSDIEDAHETVHLLDDPCVLSHLEIGYLHDDPLRVYNWFKNSISINTAEEIAKILDIFLTNSLDRI